MMSVKPNRCIINSSAENSKNIILSIAIPTYKRFELLKETLRSVYANTFYFNVEIIVVDNDPENDDIAINEMIEFKNKPLVYYKNNSNYGMFGNWNQCLTLAKGKYITILHDDDLLKENFGIALSNLVSSNSDIYAFNTSVLDERIASSKPKSHAFYSIVKHIYTSVRSFKHKFRREIDIKKLFYLNVFMGTLAVVINREKAVLLDGFDESYYPIADYHFWTKWIIAYGPIYIEPIFVASYRIRENETMKQETIDLFIEKDYQLRKEICNSVISMNKYNKLIKLLKSRDSMLFNFSWSNNENIYKKNLVNVIRYFIIRVRCAISFI